MSRAVIIIGIILFAGIVFYLKNSERFANPVTIYKTLSNVDTNLANVWNAINCPDLLAKLPTGPTKNTSPADSVAYGKCLIVDDMQKRDIPNIKSVIGTP
jgi:hypothetical protein